MGSSRSKSIKPKRLRDIVIEEDIPRRRCWLDELTADQQEQVKEVIRDMANGKLPSNISCAAVARIIEREYSPAISHNTLQVWLRTQVRISRDGEAKS